MTGSRQRSFLFLQGCGSLFFSRLGVALRDRGHGVYRVNFCGGDELFWPVLPALSYTDPHEEFADYAEHLIGTCDITDMLLLGDCRHLHRAAIGVARTRGVRTHVFEQGYLRPNWITMEAEGINGYSSLPRDPQWYLERSKLVPDYDDGQPVGSGLRQRITDDFRYQLATLTTRRYPNYRTHRPYPILAEYATWTRRLAMLPFNQRRANATTASLVRNATPYYFLALQLDSDTQVRVHSSYGRMAPALEHTLRSFAANAPDTTLLVIKNHPLDNGMVPYRSLIRRLCRELGCLDRVLYLDGGYLPDLVRHAIGTIIVNSTVGMSSLFHGRPTIALGTAVYNLPGLTFQGPLDDFWTECESPDYDLFRAFRNCLIHFTQLNGNFYSEAGQELAVAGALSRLGTADSAESLALTVPASVSLLAEGH